MNQTIEIKVPDIGDYKDVPVIEIFIKAGDVIEVEQPLVSLESDKASIDVPSPRSGRVRSIQIKEGDKVSEGSVLLALEITQTDQQSAETTQTVEKDTIGKFVPHETELNLKETGSLIAKTNHTNTNQINQPNASHSDANNSQQEQIMAVKVPDIGDFDKVPVVEIFVKVGEKVGVEQSLIALESDKATMDVPSPVAGIVESIMVKVGDKVKKDYLILNLKISSMGESNQTNNNLNHLPNNLNKVDKTTVLQTEKTIVSSTVEQPKQYSIENSLGSSNQDSTNLKAPSQADYKTNSVGNDEDNHSKICSSALLCHAGPSVRKYARELGVDISQITVSDQRGKITHDDINQFVKSALLEKNKNNGASLALSTGHPLAHLLPLPKIDFSKFGKVNSQSLSRIKKLSGANLYRNWVSIPHVTNCDDADITDLEAFRIATNQLQVKEKSEIKLTMLAFVIKASALALRKFPLFNSSLDGDNQIFKEYFNIGFAADTPNGLMVPIIRDVDKKGVLELAKETSYLAGLARTGKLKSEQMQGGCFSISSLGGIATRYFTPIINAPEVAILGIGRSAVEPFWNNKEFVPRLMLPLSLSYDHRVIDGADAARFNQYLCYLLGDFRRICL